MAGTVEFRWNDWNRENATKHGCAIDEIESVVRRGGRGFPRFIGDGKFLVCGRGIGDRMIEVIYIRDPAPAVTIYVIHAMPLTLRRRRGRK
jgi:hypothetical protein